MVTPSFRRTRIAPTPSGYLHLGNAFSFAVTAYLARLTGAAIRLRIDDLDQQRIKRPYVEDIFETLTFLRIPWDEGPRNFDEYQTNHSQTHRLARYEEALAYLRHHARVFACSCSRAAILRQQPDGSYPGTCKAKRLPLDEPHLAWRIDTGGATPLTVRTWEAASVSEPFPKSMDDFIVRKKDGFPAYQLASVVDDTQFGVDFVVRGTDLWDSTLAQLFLARRLGNASFQACTFYHHQLLTSPENEKLSKSAGATSIHTLRKQGHTAAAIYQQIGQLAGIQRPVADWQQLGDALNTGIFRPKGA